MPDEDNQFLESNMKQGTSEEKSNTNTDEDPSRLIRPEVRQGSLPGDQRIRFVRPTHPAFRRLGYGLLEATEVTEAPHGVLGRIKRLLIGAPAEPSLLGRLLHNRKVLHLKIALFFRPEIVVTTVASSQQTTADLIRPQDIRHRFIIPLAEEDHALVESVAYARSISPHVIAAHVALDPYDVEEVRSKWERLQKHLAQEGETQLIVIESPYRSLTRPLLAYIDTVHELHPEETLTVILPEYVVAHWWEYPLHNQTAFRLKTALLARPGIVVTDIPQHLSSRPGRK